MEKYGPGAPQLFTCPCRTFFPFPKFCRRPYYIYIYIIIILMWSLDSFIIFRNPGVGIIVIGHNVLALLLIGPYKAYQMWNQQKIKGCFNGMISRDVFPLKMVIFHSHGDSHSSCHQRNGDCGCFTHHQWISLSNHGEKKPPRYFNVAILLANHETFWVAEDQLPSGYVTVCYWKWP